MSLPSWVTWRSSSKHQLTLKGSVHSELVTKLQMSVNYWDMMVLQDDIANRTDADSIDECLLSIGCHFLMTIRCTADAQQHALMSKSLFCALG